MQFMLMIAWFTSNELILRIKSVVSIINRELTFSCLIQCKTSTGIIIDIPKPNETTAHWCFIWREGEFSRLNLRFCVEPFFFFWKLKLNYLIGSTQSKHILKNLTCIKLRVLLCSNKQNGQKNLAMTYLNLYPCKKIKK